MARSAEPLNARELEEKAPILCWLTQMAYTGFYPFRSPKLSMSLEVKLTGRERDILGWMADGKSVNQIAEIMNIGERTVHFHLSRVLDKFGAANKTAAIVQATLLGLI